MKGLVIEKPGKIGVVERKKPELNRGEILLELKYVGFCGSDLSIFLGKNPMVEYPRVPGHEVSAEIVKSGGDVPEGFNPGEPVTLIPYTNCGKCSSCKRGREYACRFNQTLGVQRDGAMQEYLSVPWQKIIRAPRLSHLELAMVEPLTVGFHAIDRGGVSKSDMVMVMGCGMIGAGAIAGALSREATVIAVDIDDYKLELARDLGAQHVVNSSSSDLHEQLQELTSGDGPDVVVEAAGNPVTYQAAVNEVAFTGRVVCIGYTDQEVSFATRLFVQKELDIMGSRNATQNDFKSVVSFLEQGSFPLERMITRKVRFDGVHEAIQTWADNPGRVMKILLDLT
jgi:2-desacetyl-2-hydroxyethyl bacteriochlorophyllide A dehydrogenase